MKYLALTLWIFVFEAVSMIIGTHTQGDEDSWYAALARPPFTPPEIVFPLAWIVLYALIAAAGWMLWRRNNYNLLALFAAYMSFNWSWSFVFFTFHLLLAGFIWIVALNIFSLAIVICGWKANRPAALLMIAPTLWTLYAAYLNGGIWLLNS